MDEAVVTIKQVRTSTENTERNINEFIEILSGWKFKIGILIVYVLIVTLLIINNQLSRII